MFFFRFHSFALRGVLCVCVTVLAVTYRFIGIPMTTTIVNSIGSSIIASHSVFFTSISTFFRWDGRSEPETPSCTVLPIATPREEIIFCLVPCIAQHHHHHAHDIITKPKCADDLSFSIIFLPSLPFFTYRDDIIWSSIHHLIQLQDEPRRHCPIAVGRVVQRRRSCCGGCGGGSCRDRCHRIVLLCE